MAKDKVEREGVEAVVGGAADAMNHLADSMDRLASVYEDMLEKGAFPEARAPGGACETEEAEEVEEKPRTKAAAKPKPVTKEPEAESPPDSGVEETRDAVRQVMKTLGKEEAFKILSEHGAGAEGISELKAEYYGAVVAACAESLAADPTA